MREVGTVCSVSGDTAKVAIRPGDRCGQCGGCAEDGSGRMALTVRAPRPVKAGDQVVVEFGPRHLTWGIVVAFVVPMIGLVAGVLLGQARPWARLGKDLSSALYGFALLVASFGTAAAVDRLFGKRAWPPPRIVGPASAYDATRTPP